MILFSSFKYLYYIKTSILIFKYQNIEFYKDENNNNLKIYMFLIIWSQYQIIYYIKFFFLRDKLASMI